MFKLKFEDSFNHIILVLFFGEKKSNLTPAEDTGVDRLKHRTKLFIFTKIIRFSENSGSKYLITYRRVNCYNINQFVHTMTLLTF